MELSKLVALFMVLFTTQSLKVAVYANELQNVTSTKKHIYEHYRLPTSVRPENYELIIITHLEDPSDLRFDGLVIIKLHILEDTNNITLHAQDLTIDKSKIKLKRLQELKADAHAGGRNCIKTSATNERYNYLILHLCNVARKGEEYLLVISFAGNLSKGLNGYYRSSYRNHQNNEIRWLSVTQFEPSHARKAFPCFDEPALKATFKITLGHHKQYTALSNMPLKSQRPILRLNKEDWIWSEFEESIPMSTYLVAYTVNDFAYITSEAYLNSTVSFRLWAPPDVIDQGSYASVIGPKVLRFFEDTFDQKFPLPKIDQIAIPDFATGAMENWGLITYNKIALLYDDDNPFSDKSNIAETVAHELAHQWFGNLVTMEWWTYLWLNEGFATYMSLLGVNYVHPEWNFIESQSINDLQLIFHNDLGYKPVTQHVTEISQIEDMFSFYVYNKGSLIVRMMHFFLGDETFLNGIKQYLKTHSYGNVKQDDLWNTLNEVAHVTGALSENYNVKTIMDTWTLQAGYPLITVKRDYENRTATITQSHYRINSNNTKQNCWWIPLTYTTKSELDFNKTTPQIWLECDANQVPITKTLTDMPGDNEWVIFNLKMLSLYNVEYDQRNWDMLIETINSNDCWKIEAINRAFLIDSSFTLARSANYSYDLAFRLIKYLNHEKEYLPWKMVLESLFSLEQYMTGTYDNKLFKELMVKILTPIYIHLQGLNSTNMISKVPNADAQTNIQHKVLIASWACHFEVDDCVRRALGYFSEWRNTPDPDTNNPIPTNLRDIVYCSAIRHGSVDNYNFLLARYNSNETKETEVIHKALHCSLKNRISQRSFRKKEVVYFFKTVADSSDIDFRVAKDYFVDNLQFLYELFSNDLETFSELLQSLAKRIYNRRDLEELKEFIEKNKKYFAKIEQSVDGVLNFAEMQCRWKESNYEDIVRLLKIDYAD